MHDTYLSDGKLAILSFFGLGLSLTVVNQILQCAVLLVSLVAGVLAIVRHFKNKN